MNIIKRSILLVLVFALGFFSYDAITRFFDEKNALKMFIKSLEADSRIAEVLVTGVNYDEADGSTKTTIKFLEYDIGGDPMEPRYFTFNGNLIQFQSLVIRFDDDRVRRNDDLQGKSLYLFWKVFVLDGADTVEYEISPLGEIPGGYSAGDEVGPYEAKLWSDFWKYALSEEGREGTGVKSAQIEAPGTMFVPGVLYTLRIEHDGGIRIDTKTLSPIFNGENIPATGDAANRGG